MFYFAELPTDIKEGQPALLKASMPQQLSQGTFKHVLLP